MSLLLNNAITYAKAALSKLQSTAGATGVMGVTAAGAPVLPDGTAYVPVTGSPTSLTVSSATVPTNGVYLPAANTVGVSANSTNIANFSTTGLGLGKVAASGYFLDALAPSAGISAFRFTNNTGTAGSITRVILNNGTSDVGLAFNSAAAADPSALTLFNTGNNPIHLFSGSVNRFTVNNTDCKLNGNNLVLPKTTGIGIKVDYSAPTFPWEDITGSVIVHAISPTNPTFNVFRGTIRAYQFTVNDEVWFFFHLPHNYVPGTDIHIHAHWAHASAAVISGGLTWSFVSSYAKGHNQGAFSAEVTTTVTQTASTTQYQHMIAETPISSAAGSGALLSSALFEPDGLICTRCFLSGNTINGTPEPYLLQVDLHYQSTGVGTKQKAPNFYV